MASDDKPSVLPPYPEMITTAITALNEDGGSRKAAISDYIESQQKELPAGHSTLLSHFLNKMKDNGQLEFDNLHYKMAENPPKKRGRGRPPKPKEPVPEGTPASSPRPRGRPPKPKDPLAVAAAKASAGMPKRRGRPPKNANKTTKVEVEAKAEAEAEAKVEAKAEAEAASPAATPLSGMKRGRGRPPSKGRPSKGKPKVGAASSGRGRGRPPKVKPEVVAEVAAAGSS